MPALQCEQQTHAVYAVVFCTQVDVDLAFVCGSWSSTRQAQAVACNKAIKVGSLYFCVQHDNSDCVQKGGVEITPFDDKWPGDTMLKHALHGCGEQAECPWA